MRMRAPPPYIQGVAALLAAGVVVLVHLAYLVYAAVGGFLGLRSLIWLLPHVISTAWSIVVTLTPVNCPLTALERGRLQIGGRTPYDESFTAHYLRDVVYPVRYETAIWLGMMGLAVASYVIVLGLRYRTDRVSTGPHRLRVRGTG